MLAREKKKKDAKQAAAAAAADQERRPYVLTTLMTGSGVEAVAPQLPSSRVSPLIVQIVVKAPPSLPASSLWSKQRLSESTAAQSTTAHGAHAPHHGTSVSKRPEKQKTGIGALEKQPGVIQKFQALARPHNTGTHRLYPLSPNASGADGLRPTQKASMCEAAFKTLIRVASD